MTHTCVSNTNLMRPNEMHLQLPHVQISAQNLQKFIEVKNGMSSYTKGLYAI